jgi:predicted metal-dependent hydrolase
MSDEYLYGVDLFNFAYWWECHEAWESIWKSTGPDSYEGRFLQGMVQIAAANLRKFMGSHDSGAALARKGIARLRDYEDDIFLGIDVAEFIALTHAYFTSGGHNPPTIGIRFPSCSIEFAAHE